jgi:hypothetical protein
VAALVRVGEHLGACPGSQCGRSGLAGDDDRALDRSSLADRFQHVLEHRRDQSRAALVVDAGSESLLGGAEALHG